eukprot:6488512-Amphidinium_carterae.2
MVAGMLIWKRFRHESHCFAKLKCVSPVCISVMPLSLRQVSARGPSDSHGAPVEISSRSACSSITLQSPARIVRLLASRKYSPSRCTKFSQLCLTSGERWTTTISRVMLFSLRLRAAMPTTSSVHRTSTPSRKLDLIATNSPPVA